MDESSVGGKIAKAALDGVSDVAKAQQEQAKTARKALDLVDQAGGFLGRIFSPAASEFGLMLGDQMKYWRFRNFVRVLDKAQSIVDERGISADSLRALPFGEAIRVIETASSEDDESVQELWARLIANAVDPSETTTAKKMYVDILKSMSSPEVAILDLLSRCEARIQFKSGQDIDTFNKEMNESAEMLWRKFSSDERQPAIQNLVRLRCITFRPRPIDLSNLFATLPREQYQTGMFNNNWAATDPKQFQNVINQLGELIMVSSGVKDYSQSGAISLYQEYGFARPAGKIKVPEMNFMLTPLGNALMKACRTKRT